MNSVNHLQQLTRRHLFSRCSMGLGSMALASMIADQATGAPRANVRNPLAPKPTHFPAKAKNVIWYFMLGGTSHLESFDPKPALNQHAGKSIAEEPFQGIITDSPYYRKNVRDFAGVPRNLMPKLYPLQVGYRKRGESGPFSCG